MLSFKNFGSPSPYFLDGPVVPSFGYLPDSPIKPQSESMGVIFEFDLSAFQGMQEGFQYTATEGSQYIASDVPSVSPTLSNSDRSLLPRDMTVSPPNSSTYTWDYPSDHAAPLLLKPDGLGHAGPKRSSKTSDPNNSKKSASRVLRQSQNREAQRAFRQRQRQRLEAQEQELHDLKLRYENLAERHENLRVLYMDLLRRGTQRGEEIVVPEEASVEVRVGNGIGSHSGNEQGAGVGEWLFR